MREVAEKLKAQAEPDVLVCEPKVGGRTKVKADGEIPADHVRSSGGARQAACCTARVGHAHKAYAKYRSYFEMLNFAGLLSSE